MHSIIDDLRTAYHMMTPPDKTFLGISEIEFVGHFFTGEGMTFSPEKLQKVYDFKRPEYVSEMLAFLGLINYFRDHIQDAATLITLMTANSIYRVKTRTSSVVRRRAPDRTRCHF